MCVHYPLQQWCWISRRAYPETVYKETPNKFSIHLKGPVTILTAAFLISRAIVYFYGATFYGSFVHRLWQSIDVNLLRDELWISLWYSHAQPPLFNLLTGLLVHIFPAWYMQAFHLVTLGLSLLTVLMLYKTLQLLKVPVRIAVAVSLLFMLNPALILYESVYAYTVLTIFLLGASLFTLVNFLESKKSFYWILFCFTLAALVLTRSSFHLVWMISILVMMIALVRNDYAIRRSMMKAAVVPLLLVVCWYGKNYLLFGNFGSSTWLGMNLARMVQPETPLGNIGPFRPLQDYAGLYSKDTRFFHAAVLLQERKLQTRYINFYHQDYIAISRQLQTESIRQIKADPITYLHQVMQSLIVFFSPATHAPFIDQNLEKIRGYSCIMTPDVSGFDRYRSVSSTGFKDKNIARRQFMKINHLTEIDAIPAALVFLVTMIVAFIGWRIQLMTPVDKVVVSFLLVTFAYGMLVGTLLEFGENNRFRFEISVINYVLLTLAIARLYHFFKTSGLLSKD